MRIAGLEAALTQCVLFFGLAEKKSSEELVEAQALWESIQRELDCCKWHQKRDPEIS